MWSCAPSHRNSVGSLAMHDVYVRVIVQLAISVIETPLASTADSPSGPGRLDEVYRTPLSPEVK